jgi:hypothetical protein
MNTDEINELKQRVEIMTQHFLFFAAKAGATDTMLNMLFTIIGRSGAIPWMLEYLEKDAIPAALEATKLKEYKGLHPALASSIRYQEDIFLRDHILVLHHILGIGEGMNWTPS